MSQPTNPPAKPRRWWRFFVQFSLRSLLVVTTIAAVACWWFLQPPTREEELAGKRLKLRRQVRMTRLPEGALANRDPFVTPRDGVVLTNIGSWRLIDEHGNPLVAGRFDNDVPHGKWTVYHTSGRKAAEGRVVRGARDGVWRTWDAEGRLLSEVTYVAQKRDGAWGGGTTSTGLAIEPGDPFAGLAPLHFVAKRHGPARTWYPSGQLKLAGHYADDRREGHWAEYDEQGQVVAEGDYRADRKEGPWKERGTAADGRTLELRTIEYVGGRSREAREQLLARLRTELRSGAPERQVAAVQRLIELGVHGTPLLLEALDEQDDNLRLIALRALEQIVTRAVMPRPVVAVPLDTPPSASALPTNELAAKALPLVEAEDGRLARPATLIAYHVAPVERQRLRARLIELVQSSSEPAWQRRALQALFAVEPERQAENFVTLAKTAQPHIKVTQAGFAAMSYQSDEYQFRALAWELPDLPAVLTAQSQSRDLAVRRFVLAVVNCLAFRGRPTRVTLPGGAVVNQYPVPAAFEELVKRAQSDPDATVRAAAENVGRTPMLPTGMGGGFF